MPQIELQQIRKTFVVYERREGRFSVLRGAFSRQRREVKALEDITFSIHEGELVGYIGPNGAGKSTTVKVMSGILTPDGGSCRILGRVPWKERVAHVAQIGVVFGQRSQLWWDVPVSDSFDVLRDIYGHDLADEKRLRQLIEALDVGSLLKTPVRQLSLGQRMRCEIIAALLHNPRILFLDEPTIGLDAISKLALRTFLRDENQRGDVTMILTTHDMDDIEALCPRVMVIGHGALLFDGQLSALKSRYSPLRRIRIVLRSALDVAPNIQDVLKIEGKERNWTLWFSPAQIASHELVARLSSCLPLEDVILEEEDIDEMIASMYKELKL